MDERDLTETQVSREVMYPGYIVRLEHWQVRMPDGSVAMREIACLNGASAVVALDADGQIILVRQYRSAVSRLTRELPAGKLDSPDEDPLFCAKRELSQETGMTADHWRLLTVLEPTPGFCSQRIHLYLATGLHPGDAHPDPGEFVDVIRMPIQEAAAQVMSGTIRDGKTALGIMMASSAL